MKKIAFLSQIKEFFVKICKTNKKLLFLAVALILILIVAVISSFSNSSEIKNKSLNSSETLTINNYADSLELKIENLLSSMS